MYEGRLKIAKMEDYKFDTFKKEIKFTPATNTDVVASKLLSPQEINKIAKPITLHGIAQFINNKIDIQEPLLKETETSNANKALLDFTQRKQK